MSLYMGNTFIILLLVWVSLYGEDSWILFCIIYVYYSLWCIGPFISLSEILRLLDFYSNAFPLFECAFLVICSFSCIINLC